MGKGNVRLLINRLVQIVIVVFYVPDLRKNLLSIGQLQEKGIDIVIQRERCKLFHPERGLIMDIVMSKNRMFILITQIKSMEQTYFNSLIDELDQL